MLPGEYSSTIVLEQNYCMPTRWNVALSLKISVNNVVAVLLTVVAWLPLVSCSPVLGYVYPQAIAPSQASGYCPSRRVKPLWRRLLALC